MTSPENGNPPPPRKRENLLLNLLFNIAAPTLILSKLSGERWLGPAWGLVVALACPLGYFGYDYAARRRANFISMIGIVSVLATGGLGLMKAGGLWFAVKEAAVPLVVGLGVVVSTGGRRPLVRELLFNEDVIDAPKVNAALEARGARAEFEALLRRSGYLLALGFLMSAALNFTLVRIILRSAPGTPEFNAELGRINLVSWPVVVAPTLVITLFALWRLMNGLKRMTGLELEEMFHGEKAKLEPGAGAQAASSGQDGELPPGKANQDSDPT